MMSEPVRLTPKAVSALYSGRSIILHKLSLDRLTPVQRIALMTLLYLIALIAVAAHEDSLFRQGASGTGVALFGHDWRVGQPLSTPLTEDLVGILAIAAAFLTPLICLRQAEAMEEMIPVHRENIAYRKASFDWQAVDKVTARANRMFRLIGSKAGSAASLVLAMVLVLPLLNLVRDRGLLSNFRPRHVTGSEWHSSVLSGWWAGAADSYPLGFLMLNLAGVLLYFFVVKQVALGLVFVYWIQGITAAGFGTFENLSYNSDGHWGMRVTRRLFQSTYASAILHLVLSLVVIALWLPLHPLTIVIATIITIADALFVIYPTMTTIRGVMLERRLYVHSLKARRAANRDEAIEAVWNRPILPFRLRATVSATLLYFLIPTAVAILSNRLGK